MGLYRELGSNQHNQGQNLGGLPLADLGVVPSAGIMGVLFLLSYPRSLRCLGAGLEPTSRPRAKYWSRTSSFRVSAERSTVKLTWLKVAAMPGGRRSCY